MLPPPPVIPSGQMKGIYFFVIWVFEINSRDAANSLDTYNLKPLNAFSCGKIIKQWRYYMA